MIKYKQLIVWSLLALSVLNGCQKELEVHIVHSLRDVNFILKLLKEICKNPINH